MIKEALEAFAKAQERPWQHDRTKSIGASEIGLCARRSWFLKHGAAPDPQYADRWGARQRGNLIEAFWERALRAHLGKGVLHYAGRRQKTLVDEESSLSATPDGLVVEASGHCYTVECKSIDPRAAIETAKPEHVYQVQVQLGLIRQLTRYRPEYGILTYIDASFLDESREFEIAFDPVIFEHAKERARAIMHANSAEQLRPEGYIAGGAECQYCAFRHSCSDMRFGAVPANEQKLDAAAIAEVTRLAQERADLKAGAERLEQQAREAEEDIKDILRLHDTRRAEGEGVRVVWSALKGRPSWDMPALRTAAEEAGLNLAPFEKTGEPSDRLQIRLGPAPAVVKREAA